MVGYKISTAMSSAIHTCTVTHVDGQVSVLVNEPRPFNRTRSVGAGIMLAVVITDLPLQDDQEGDPSA